VSTITPVRSSPESVFLLTDQLSARGLLQRGLGFAALHSWFAADEVAMPVLGLSEPTTRRPLEMHLQSLTAHLVYGAMTEVVRRLVRSQLGAVPSAA
jgi:uncharacterized membrane protein YagU involved in acid resistance